MIVETKAFQVGQLVFPILQDAQKYEIATLLKPWNPIPDENLCDVAAQKIVEHTDEIVAILTYQPNPKAPRKPRSDIGTKRKPKGSGGGLIIRGDEVP